MHALTEQEEQAFVNYMVDTVGVRNHTTLHDAVCWARIWVIEGGYPDADNLWVMFVTKATASNLTDHFQKSSQPLPKTASKLIFAVNSKLA